MGQLSNLLTNNGYDKYFIEVGGEVKVSGCNPDGDYWKIGIQDPESTLFEYSLNGIVHISKGSLATSGGYRNFREKNGNRYAHIIDPRDGKAISSNLLSVSVLSDKCIDADGWATALYVLGVKDGLICVERQPHIEALFIMKNEDNQIETIFSSKFEEKTKYELISKTAE